MRHTSLSALVLAGIASPSFADTDRSEVVSTYADIAQAAYQDSLTTAQTLKTQIDAFLADPSAAGLDASRAAWISARVPYMQTEAFRFGNPAVDDWEGKVNAWPLDEGLIDAVAPGYFGAGENAFAQLNVIATPRFTLSGQDVDAATITPALLSDTLQEADGSEANVATGYHAIEFLLWGQDLVSDAPQAGQRPYTDFLQGDDCTAGNCDRRAAYLSVATDLLISDLEQMVAAWGTGGEARADVTADPDTGIAAILTGIGNLSYGEMAGQRVKLGLLLNDPEEEHDCFSDNTPASHYNDVLGMQNVYLGQYTRTDGTVVTGPALRDLVAEADPDLAQTLTAQMTDTLAAAQALVQAKADGTHYDMLLQVGNPRGEALIMPLVDRLVDQSRSIERASAALSLTSVAIAGDDTLDSAGDTFE